MPLELLDVIPLLLLEGIPLLLDSIPPTPLDDEPPAPLPVFPGGIGSAGQPATRKSGTTRLTTKWRMIG